MKKVLIRLAIIVAGLIGISVANNVVMLKIHPLEFYYTPTGLLISAVVMGLEMMILYPVIGWHFKKIVYEYNEWLNNG